MATKPVTAVFLAVLLAASVIAHGQTRPSAAPPPANGALSGRVLADDGGSEPVRRASVHVQRLDAGLRSDVPERIAVTNDEGTFAFTQLPAGRYRVWVTKNAWVPAWYGSKRPGDAVGAMSIVIQAGQTSAPITLRMKRGAVVTGTVSDQDGQPLAGVLVSVLQERPDFQTGVRSLVPIATAELALTDNRGVYRIYGLAPGTYLVRSDYAPRPFRLPSEAEWKWADSVASGASSPPEPGRPRRYAPVFHPGTPEPGNATAVTLRAGDERAGIDIRMESMAVASIIGTVQAADPAWVRDATLVVIGPGSGRVVAQARTDANGLFTLANVPPGSYAVVARPASATTARFSGSSAVTVAGADESVTVTLEPGVDVKGRVVLTAAGQAPPADLTRARISIVPTSLEAQLSVPAPVQPAASGEFTIPGVAPGSYRISATLPGGAPGATWAAATAMVRDRDALDVPITVSAGSPVEAVITFTDRETAIGGTMTDSSGRPAPDYFVIAFPTDRNLWAVGSRRIVAGRPGIDGRYRLNLPAGSYLVAAVTDVEPFQWFDAAFLSELEPFAIKLTVADGQVLTQDLRLGGRW